MPAPAQLSVLARKLETAAKSGDVAITREGLERIEACWQATVAGIESLADQSHTAVA